MYMYLTLSSKSMTIMQALVTKEVYMWRKPDACLHISFKVRCRNRQKLKTRCMDFLVQENQHGNPVKTFKTCNLTSTNEALQQFDHAASDCYFLNLHFKLRVIRTSMVLEYNVTVRHLLKISDRVLVKLISEKMKNTQHDIQITHYIEPSVS